MSNSPNRDIVTPLKMTEDLVETLRQETISAAEIRQRLERLKEVLDNRFESPENKGVIENLVSRSPWLTSDAERLRQLQTDMLQSVESCFDHVKNTDGSRDFCRRLIKQLSEFAELYVEAESAHEELLHAAFPGPGSGLGC